MLKVNGKQCGFVVETLTLVVITAVILVIGWAIRSYQCEARWSYSGLSTSWGPLQGCLVRLQDGRMLPENRVREFDIKPTK